VGGFWNFPKGIAERKSPTATGVHRPGRPQNDLQWSFGKTGTMGTLMSQPEIGVWVPAPEAILRGSEGITPGNIWRLYMQNPAICCIFDRKMVQMPSTMRSLTL